MDESQIYSQVTEVFRDVFNQADMILHPELTAKDVPGWDSFKQIEIIIALEEKYRIKFHTRDLDNLKNVGDLVNVVSKKTGLS